MLELSHNCLTWFKRYYFLYIFGFLLNFNPIDPYLYDMILTNRTITGEQYDVDIRPISAYVAAAFAVLIFLLAGFCMLNYFLIIYCVGGLAAAIIIWLGKAALMQATEVLTGIVSSTEIIYFASIYCFHDTQKDFARLTSHLRAAPLAAKFISGLIAQIFSTDGRMSYEELSFLSVPACVHAILVIFHIPPLYEPEQPPEKLLSKIEWFKSKFKETFSNDYVLKWSLWIGFTLAGYAQVVRSVDPYWRTTEEYSYNGAVQAVLSLLAFIGVLLTGITKKFRNFHNVVLLVISLLQGVTVAAIATAENVWDTCICYVLYGTAHNIAVTVLSATIAVNVHDRGSLVIVFGFIGLVAAMLNLIFVSLLNSTLLDITYSDQFLVYGGYHLLIVLLTLISWTLRM